jgi:hypothetical protein
LDENADDLAVFYAEAVALAALLPPSKLNQLVSNVNHVFTTCARRTDCDTCSYRQICWQGSNSDVLEQCVKNNNNG